MSAVATGTSAPSSLTLAFRLWRLFVGYTVADHRNWSLPVVAQAVVSTLVLSVVGGVRWFFAATGEIAQVYQMLSVVALILLVVPLASLAGAGARLSANRRDTRLSSLRLIGANTTTIRLLTLLETGTVAFAGAVLGIAGHLLLLPVLGELRFMGRRIGAVGLALPPSWALGVIGGIVTLAVISSALGLRRVEISPLGVRTREQAPRMHWLRVAFAIVAFTIAGCVVAALQTAPQSVLIGALVLLAMFALPMAALNLIGPWVLGVLARAAARRARTAVQLLAARSTADNPKQLWRQIGALGLISFVAVFCGVAVSLSQTAPQSTADALLLDDLRTGVLLTAAISFVTVACSVGLNQAAAILDRRSLYVGLDLVGMPLAAIDTARRRAVLSPLLLVVGSGAGSAAALLAPLVGRAHVSDLPALVTVAVTLGVGIGLVVVSLVLTSFTVRAVVRDGVARAE